MKFPIIGLIIFFVISAGFSQEESNQKNQSLDDVVVQEKYQAGGEEEKLPVFLKTDFSNLVELPERIHWSAVAWEYGDQKPSPDLFDLRISSPELDRVIPTPANTFHVSFKDLSNWKLEIFTSDGQKFRSVTGEGDPPRAINWDGLKDDGSPLQPGAHYAYSFTAIDRAGNKRTFPGEAFSVPALYLPTDQGIWIGLSDNSLFSPDGFGLSRDASEFARELVNFIYYFAQQGEIVVQSSHPDTDQFLQLLAHQLGRDVSSFTRVSDRSPLRNCFLMWVN